MASPIVLLNFPHIYGNMSEEEYEDYEDEEAGSPKSIPVPTTVFSQLQTGESTLAALLQVAALLFLSSSLPT